MPGAATLGTAARNRTVEAVTVGTRAGSHSPTPSKPSGARTTSGKIIRETAHLTVSPAADQALPADSRGWSRRE